MLVGIGETEAVRVADETAVDVLSEVAVTEPFVDAVEAEFTVRRGVLLENEKPGVNRLFRETGLVRTAGSIGSMNPSGLFVR